MADNTISELKFQRLLAAVDLFVNGGADELVAISNGRTVGTLAGIDKRAYKTKYVQKIVDYDKLSDAELDAAGSVLIVPGNVVRVYGEADVSLNRLYQVQHDKTLLQIDYTDVYDLKNSIPYPYNNKLVRQSLTQLYDPQNNQLLTYTVQPSEANAYHIFLRGTYKVSSHKAGFEGMISGKFNLVVSLKGDVLTQSYMLDGPLNYLLPTAMPWPTLQATLNQEVAPGSNVVYIKPLWTQTIFNQSDPVMVEWFIENIDKTPFY